jgi:hypothetical protein
MSVVQFLISEIKFLTCSIDISVVCGTAPEMQHFCQWNSS